MENYPREPERDKSRYLERAALLAEVAFSLFENYLQQKNHNNFKEDKAA